MPSGVLPFTDNTSVRLSQVVRGLYHGLQTQSSNNRPLEWARTRRFVRQSHHLRPTFPDWSAALIIELLRAGKPVRFRARGGSMWPTIPGGSLVEVTPGAPKAAGELVAFEREGRVVVHRVGQITADGVVAQGDALGSADGVVPGERVLGTARVIERRQLNLRLPKASELELVARALWRRVTARWHRRRVRPT
jgi:hypothetical protein